MKKLCLVRFDPVVSVRLALQLRIYDLCELLTSSSIHPSKGRKRKEYRSTKFPWTHKCDENRAQYFHYDASQKEIELVEHMKNDE